MIEHTVTWKTWLQSEAVSTNKFMTTNMASCTRHVVYIFLLIAICSVHVYSSQGNAKKKSNQKSQEKRPEVLNRDKREGKIIYGVERQRVPDNNFILSAKRFLDGKSITPIEYSVKEEMVDKIIANLKREPKAGSKGDYCIQELHLYGHGVPGVLSVGNGQSSAYRQSTYVADLEKYKFKENEWQDKFKRIQNRFCSDGEIKLFGCNIGANEEGARLLYQMAKYFHVTVTAPVNIYRVDNYSGEWQQSLKESKSPPEKKMPSDRVFTRRRR